MKTLQESIGCVIQMLRKERGISQERLALESGIDRRYMSDVENGKRNISVDILERLARYFHVDVTYIMLRAEHGLNMPKDVKELRTWLVERGEEEVVMLENPDYITALIGQTADGRLVYHHDLMVRHLVEADGMDVEEAMDFISYNTLRALPYAGEKAPVILINSDFD